MVRGTGGGIEARRVSQKTYKEFKVSTVTIVLTVPVSSATVNGWLRLVPGHSPESLQRIASYFSGIAGGPFSGKAVVTVGANPPVTVYNGQA